MVGLMLSLARLADKKPHGPSLPVPRNGHVVLEHLRVSFGSGPHARAAVDDFSLDVTPGEFVCISGRRAAASRPCST